MVSQDKCCELDTEAQIRNTNGKKKSFKIGQLSRVESMENETFLIKMFFSTSPASTNKAKTVNHSRVSSASK